MGSTPARGPPQTLAQRQVRQQQEAQRAQQRAESKRREELLAQENARLRRQIAAHSNRQADADMDLSDEIDDGEEQEMPEEERKRRIEEIKNGLAYLAFKFGDDSSELQEAKRELAALERASREAKPYKTHRAQLERRKERLIRQRDKAQEECDDVQNQITDLQARLSDLKSANESREQEIAEVDSELKELLRRAIAEGDDEHGAQQPPMLDPSAAWNTVSETLAGMASQPGVPREWAAQLGGLLDQLRSAALAIQSQATIAAGTSHAIGASTTATSTGGGSPAATAPPHVQGAHQSPTPATATTTANKEDGLPTMQQQANDGAGATGSSSDQAAAIQASGGSGSIEDKAVGIGLTQSGPGSTAAGVAAPSAAAALAAAPKSPENLPNDDQDSAPSDDDMDSIAGEEFNLQAGESEVDRKKRIRLHLREREQRRAEAKRKERLASRRLKEGGQSSTGNKVASQKTKGK